MPDNEGKPALGRLIREHRNALGYSQGRLAELLCQISGTATLTREYVSRWERGQRSPGRYWLPHVAAALQVPLHVLEAEEVKRRQFLRLTAQTSAASLLDIPDTATELLASIAGGDPGPLTEVQTTHRTDLAVSRLASTDRSSVLRLARWMADGNTAVLRVNAAGILAKTAGQPDALDDVALTLARDEQTRDRYLWALTLRVGSTVPALAAEVLNPRDAGARWCATRLLGQDGSPAARRALATALRRDPVRENVRAIGLPLTGADPCT
ncbi:helix-turn-helix domain-containing protein [Actinophytocola oryzae]|uniref:Helix-turn-helix protein n=1 Tax=Actinophytocola oryzae TaxID=502181 RepID=A0A4R7VVJ4_9PSEU|nr:helix-turn-helix transcriptional regulator [Actinophytocola oryzae]TDV53914.1 helix-turn-helix protein [Actinophytocola oryzae]